MLRTIGLALAIGVIVPSIGDAGWTRVQLPDGSQACQDAATGAKFKPPYSAKADVTKACNVLTSFVPWLGTADAATVLTTTRINPDGTQDTGYPNDSKNNATVAWNDTTLATAMSVVVAQNTGTATDINLATYCTGTGCATATYSIVTAVTGWSIGGSGISHLLNSGASAGTSAVLGTLTLKVTNGASTDTSAAFAWSYVVPPVPAMKWHPGYVFDCWQEIGTVLIATNRSSYTQITSCMDFAAAHGMDKVFVFLSPTSLEGNTAGSYAGSSASANYFGGTYGYALVDALLSYAASKSLRVGIGIEGIHVGGYAGCGSVGGPGSFIPAYQLQSTCSPGTDASNTYGATLGTNVIFPRYWKAAVMDRYIAMVQAYCDRYDSSSTLEFLALFTEEAAPGNLANGTDGYSDSATTTQLVRMANAVRSHCQHTTVSIQNAWLDNTLTLVQAMGSGSNYIAQSVSDAIVWESVYSDRAYLGQGAPFGTHSYRSEIPYFTYVTAPVSCNEWDSYAGHNGLPASANSTPQDFYDVFMTNGKPDQSPAVALRPSYFIVGRSNGLECPLVASQQWAAWESFIPTHPLNTTCPSLYAGGCNTN